jgi:hypothetical protein
VVERFVGKLDIPADSQGYKIFNAVRKKLALPESSGNGGLRLNVFTWPDNKPIPLENAKNLFRASGSPCYADLGTGTDGKNLYVKMKEGHLVGMVNSRIDKQFDFDTLFPDAAKASAPPSFEWNVDGRTFSIIITSSYWETHPDGKRQPDGVSFLVLEK